MTDRSGSGFRLDNRLGWDSVHLIQLELCELRIMNDRRWPWLILVPQRPQIAEIHDLSPMDQTMLAVETGFAAATLKATTGCGKINTGALGNIVRQLHVHVVARSEGDANWPGPVWGFGEREAYSPAELESMTSALRAAFDQASAEAGDLT